MKLELEVIDLLHMVGIRKGWTVLDFGCGYGMYTLPLAELVGEHGTIYAMDKDTQALDELRQKAALAQHKNIRIMATSGELTWNFNDSCFDAVLLFEVFHAFYFPSQNDREALLAEIRRIMKPCASLYLSAWPDALEPGTMKELKDAGFRSEKEVSGASAYCHALKACTVVEYKKYPVLISSDRQIKRRNYEPGNRN